MAAGRTSLKMKSTNTTTFHKNAHILQNEHEQQGEIIGATPGESIRLNEDEEDSFPELNELKQYFLTCEKDEFDGLTDGFEDEPDIVSKFDLNEGGESDFSEEFEQAIANGSNRKEGSSEKEGKEKRTPVVALKSNAISSEPKSKRSNNDFDNSEKKGLMYLRKNKTNQPSKQYTNKHSFSVEWTILSMVGHHVLYWNVPFLFLSILGEEIRTEYREWSTGTISGLASVCVESLTVVECENDIIICIDHWVL